MRPPEELAARLAQRLCHDLVGPANAILLGLDLAAEAGAEETRREALAAAAAGARRLTDLLEFSRAAFGVGDEMFETDRLEALTRAIFADLRPRLEWAVDAPTLAAAAGRCVLNAVQIAAGAVASGGLVRARFDLQASGATLAVGALGPRAELHPEVSAGLAGSQFGRGRGGLWAQARYLHALVTAAGGSLSARAAPLGVLFEIYLPA